MNKKIFQDTNIDQLNIYNAKKLDLDRKSENKVKFFTPSDSKKSQDSNKSVKSKTDQVDPNLKLIQETNSILMLESKKQNKTTSSSAPAIFKLAYKLKRLTTNTKMRKNETEGSSLLNKGLIEDHQLFKTNNNNNKIDIEKRKNELSVENNLEYSKSDDFSSFSCK